MTQLLQDFVESWPHIVALWSIIIVGIFEAAEQALSSAPTLSGHLPHVAGWIHYIPLTLLILAGLSWLYGSFRGRKHKEQPRPSTSDLRIAESEITVKEYLSPALTEFDPKICVEFRDDRRAGVLGDKDNSRIVVVNRAQSRALLVCIPAIRLHDTIIKFSMVAEALSSRESASFSPVIERHDHANPPDIFLAVFWEWDHLNNRSIPDISIPLHVFYQDDVHNLFETTCDLVFSIEEHLKVRTQGQSGSINVIEVKNQQWQRKAISSLLRRD